jgi:hypothetical protein
MVLNAAVGNRAPHFLNCQRLAHLLLHPCGRKGFTLVMISSQWTDGPMLKVISIE